MAGILEKDFYELLDLSPSASREDIERAYKIAHEVYNEGSLATYSIINSEERESILLKVRAAYEVLINDELRRRYNDSLGKQTHTAEFSPAPPAEPKPLQQAALPETPRLEMPLRKEAAKVSEVPIIPVQPRQIDESKFNGSDLRRIREELKIDLHAIADHTKISISTLRFIEDNNYDLLPAPIYIRGFIKQFAVILNIDPEKASRAFMKHYSAYIESVKKF